MGTPQQARVAKLRQMMAELKADVFLANYVPNVFYLTGFDGSAGLALVEERRVTVLTDSRYRTQAAQQARGCRVVVARGSLLDAAREHLGRLGRACVAFEASHLSVAQKSALARRMHAGRAHWLPVENVVERLRMVKDPAEVKVIRAAARLGCRVFSEVLPLVRPGVREVELAAEVEYRMRRRGASGPAFETIVASGPRSALPHARATTRRLRKKELVVCDLGAILAHYCCDLTRTVYLGKPPTSLLKWFRAVREAHDAAASILRAGVTGGQVDAAARAILKGHGLEKHFIHSCGHGLGLEIHEEPRLARDVRTPLETGTVVTIEPGVYVEGVGGIRIEDDYVIKRNGAERLTNTCKDVFAL